MSDAKRIGVMIATPLRHFPERPKDGESAEDFARRQRRALTENVPQIGRALKELHDRREEHEYEFEFAAACGGLCSARNRLVHDFLHKSSASILLWHDADLHDQAGKDADAILRQLTIARRNGAHVLGRLYCKREKRPRWVANWINEAKIQDDGLLQVAEIGGGATMYSRGVLEHLRKVYVDDIKAAKADAMAKGAPVEGLEPMEYRDRETGEMVTAFFQIRTIDGDLLSEDFHLNFLARCAKIPIWADTVAKMRHFDGVDQYPPRGSPWPPLPAESNL